MSRFLCGPSRIKRKSVGLHVLGNCLVFSYIHEYTCNDRNVGRVVYSSVRVISNAITSSKIKAEFSRQRVDPISKHTNGDGTNKNLVMSSDTARNQDQLCWRGQQQFTAMLCYSKEFLFSDEAGGT
jgi:hypothetical protein